MMSVRFLKPEIFLITNIDQIMIKPKLATAAIILIEVIAESMEMPFN